MSKEQDAFSQVLFDAVFSSSHDTTSSSRGVDRWIQNNTSLRGGAFAPTKQSTSQLVQDETSHGLLRKLTLSRNDAFMRSLLALLTFFLTLTPTSLFAGSSTLPGEALSLWWALPFLGMLFSIALFPLLAIRTWEYHMGKIVIGWSLLTLCALTFVFGVPSSGQEVLGTLLHHYLPFVIMIGALYTVAGGIQIDIQTAATPLSNTLLLAIGTFFAGWIGTTGAAMLFIRPLLQINKQRKFRVHQMIFFIFLVANIGGALTPLGDPPLFLGFLAGISFTWSIQNLAFEMIVLSCLLLSLFYVFDFFLSRREGRSTKYVRPTYTIKGAFNGLFFIGIIGLVLLSGIWKSHSSLMIGPVEIELQNAVRDVGLILLAGLSWILTPAPLHKANHFSWEPLLEVAKLFFGIFITAIPVLAILDAGTKGAFSPLISLVYQEGIPQNNMFFWTTGLLSAFLDNAPTYLVFFHVAGGDANSLMTTLSKTLEAISLGSVFLGALTYIGNAPNFMIKTIAEGHRIKMPSFFGYMLWSVGILIPLLLFLSWWRFIL